MAGTQPNWADLMDWLDSTAAPSARADPATSRLAGAELSASGARRVQAERVLALVRQCPGATAAELAAGTHDLDNVRVLRRLDDLRKLGRVRQGAARTCSCKSRRMMTWWPA